MKKKTKLIRWLKTKRFTKQNLWVYKPCMYYINRNATVRIEKFLDFNKQWDDERILRNKMVGCLYMGENSVLNVDSFTVYSGSRITIDKGATLSLGSGYMNYGCIINCYHSISIGYDVAIAPNVILRDSDNHEVKPIERGEMNSEKKKVASPIVIKDHVWIGMGVTILKGVTIGEGSIIAAGSLVNKDVPPYTLVAGVPAKVVKTNVSWGS